MAKYRITAPDGNTYEINAPEGATEDQVLAYAQQNYQQPKQEARPQAPIDTTSDMSLLDRIGAGVGKSFVDTGTGLKQAVTERIRGMAGGDFVGAMPEGMHYRNAVTDWADRSLAEQKAEIANRRETDAPLMATGGGLAGNIGGQIAQMAVPVGTLRGAPYINAALRGAAFSGAQPVAEGESRGAHAAEGAAWGLAGQGIASGLGKIAAKAGDKLAPAVRESIELARRAGIPLNLAQVTESMPLKAAVAASKWLPFSGAGKAAKSQQEAFNAALGRSMGLDGATSLTDDVMRGARKKIGGVFEDIYNRNDVALTPDALRKLTAVESEAVKNLTKEEARVLRNQFDRILDNADNGVLTGKKYQAVRTLIQKAEGPDKVGSAVKELRKTLDDVAAQAVGPDDAAALAKSRGQWANLRVVEDALKQVGEAGKGGAAGNVRPGALWPLVRKGSTKEMRELAKIGQNVLKDGLGDSGTAQRQFYTSLLAGGGAASMGALPLLAKGIAGGAVAGRALNSNIASKLLAQGKPAAGLARLAQGAPQALPVIGPRMGLPALLGLDIAGGRVATPEEIAADEEIVRRFKAGQR